MTTRRLPLLRPDGTFCVEVGLSVKTDAPASLLENFTAWAKRWLLEHETWERQWDTKRIERLNFYDEFSALQVVSCTASKLVFRLEGKQVQGKPGNRWWKDWLVLRLLPEVRVAFAEVTALESIKNCDPDG